MMISGILTGVHETSFGQSIVINEIMSANDSDISDEEGDHEDWIEIFNASKDSVSMKDFGLSDDEDELHQWIFPDTTIAPGAFMVIWASGKDRADGNNKIPFFKRVEKFMNYEPIPDPPRPLHSSFSIKSDGEELLLTDPSGNIVDRWEPVEIPDDMTFGRYPDGDDMKVYFNEPTAGYPNSGNHAEDIPE